MSVQLIVCPWVASTRLQRGNPAQIMKAAASAVRRGVLRRWLQYTHTHTYTRLSTLMVFWDNLTLTQKHTLFPQIMFTTITLASGIDGGSMFINFEYFSRPRHLIHDFSLKYSLQKETF